MTRLLAALAALPLAVLAACSGGATGDEPQEIDTAKVERVIARQVERQTGYPVHVGCPSQMTLEVGREFHCVVRGNGARAMATVTVENGAGEFTWETGR